MLRAVSIPEEFGPSLGIFINLSKCEVFSRNDVHSFPAAMKASHLPHMVILGAPIGDYLFCANFIASKHLDAVKLLSKFVEIVRYVGLGLRSLSHHSSAAFIASVCSSGFGDRNNQYLVQAINPFNIQVLPSDAISVESVLSSPTKQRT